MDEREKRNGNAGRLYLAATPIGNMEDMTYRCVRILSEVPLIAAEDTRHTRQLLAHFHIHTRLTSYHEHNKLVKGPELIGHLLSGKDLVCVSDAGLPGICDPGSHLAGLAIAAGIEVTPLPGANAALSALICSGLDTARFTFVGFLPKTAKKQRALLEKLEQREETLVFYEAPHHLRATLKELSDVLGEERQAVVCRELTKKFEEFRRGTLAEHFAFYGEEEPRGEFVLVVEGYKEGGSSPSGEQPKTPVELYRSFLLQGMEKKEAMREAAKKLGISRRDVYSAILEQPEGQD